MRNYPKFICLLTVVFLFGSDAFAQKGRKKPSPRKEIVQAVAESNVQANFLGKVTGNTYQNEFFDLKLNIAESWLIQERAVSNAIKEVGSEMVAGKTSQTQKAYNAAVQRLTVLITVSRDILGIENNATFILSAEKSTPLVQIRNGRDYLRFNIQSFKKLQLPPDFKYSETIESEKFGSETFYSLDVQRVTYKQRFYATYRKGYSLFFTLSYGNEEDLETMKEILRTADFAWKK